MPQLLPMYVQLKELVGCLGLMALLDNISVYIEL